MCDSCAGAEESSNCSTCVRCQGLAVDTVADSTPAPDIEPLHVPASPSPSAGTEAAGPDELSPLENGSLSSAWTSKYSNNFLMQLSKSGKSFQFYRYQIEHDIIPIRSKH